MTFLYHANVGKFPRNFSGKVPLFFQKFLEKFCRKFPEISHLTTLLLSVFVSGKDADNGAADNTSIIGIVVGVSVGLLCIAAVITVIAVLIYRYKVKNRYNECL